MEAAASAAGLGEVRARAASAGARVVALGVSGAMAAILVVGAWLQPDPAGHGSHMQLGLPPCAWAAVLHAPCPTCGMTTAVSLAARGRLWDSFATQPFGLVVALAAAVGFWSGLHVAVTGSQLGRVYGRLMTPAVLWSVAALAAAAWAYKWATWPG